MGGKVPCVISAKLLACGAEWLARRASRPDWPIIWPACKPQCVGPSADACEEMALGEPGQVGRSNIEN
jgi:hypothetical protein